MQNLANLSNLSGLGVSGGSLFKPNALFRAGEQGVWFDPSDMSTLFQDSDGTTPVTGMEQPVGLIVDKSVSGGGTGRFVPLGQTSRLWRSMTTLGSDVYAGVNNGDIYKQTGGTGDFVGLGQTSRQWRGITTLGSDVYVTVWGGDIYKQTGGTGDFVALGQTSRNWRGMTTLGSDVYASVDGGDIYKQTGGTGDFVALNQTSRRWFAMTTLGSDVYAVVYNGDIYKQTGGVGDFVALGQTTRGWSGITTLGSDIYASVDGGDIYKQTGGTGNFVALSQTSRSWWGMTTLGGDVYAAVYGGDIYKLDSRPRSAFQATSASRPTLSARVNMLVNTDTLSTQNVTVAKQDYTLRLEGSGSVRDTVPLGQGTRAWAGMTTLGSDVYASVHNGDIYKQTGGTGDFEALGQTSRLWIGMTTLGSDVYAVVTGGDIYKQTGGTGNFVGLGQTSRNWSGMTTLGSNVYATVYNGDIYKQTGGTGNFVALGQTSRQWYSMTTLGSDVYAGVAGGDIYKQTGGTGNFVGLGQTSRQWRGITTLGNDIYAVVFGGDIYKQTGGTGDFVALGQTSRQWIGMTTLGSDVYALVYNGDIYKMATPKTAGSYTIPSGAGAMSLVVSGSVSNADLRPSNVGNLPPYQRVGNVGTTPSDYNDVGFPKYLRFDGVDDALETNAIDFTTTDEMNVFAGVRKESDAKAGVVTELSTTTASNNGSFALQAPDADTANTFEYESKGTSLTDTKKTSVVAPLSGVLTGISDISSDTNILRVDSIQAESDTADQGTGNYGNYPLYIGARGGTSLFFVGRLYQLLIRGKLSTDSQVRGTERFISKKTGL